MYAQLWSMPALSGMAPYVKRMPYSSKGSRLQSPVASSKLRGAHPKVNYFKLSIGHHSAGGVKLQVCVCSTAYSTFNKSHWQTAYLQRRALKIIIRKPIFQHCDHNDLLLTLNQASLQSRRHFQSALVGFHLANQTAPPHLQEVCYPRASVDHSLRHHNFFQLPKANSTLFQSSPLYFASHIFNILPKHIQSGTRLSEFKKKAQQYFLSPVLPLLNARPHIYVTFLSSHVKHTSVCTALYKVPAFLQIQ